MAHSKWPSARHICYCATYLELAHNLPASSDKEGVSARPNACMLKGCAVASDSGWPAAAAGQNGDLGHHFPPTPLEVAWGGTCTAPIESYLDPVSQYIAGIYLHHRRLRLICIKGTAQSIFSPAPSKKIRYAEIDAFHRHHGPMARAACGGRGAVGRP